MDEVDESETGSANLWSGPRKGAGRFFGHFLGILEEDDEEEDSEEDP